MRHAKSAWNSDAPTDHARPLTGRGRRAARRMGRWLTANNCEPDLILASTATRVQETIGRMAKVFDMTDNIVCDERFYGADTATWLDALGQVEPAHQTVLLCGHNPGLEDLAARLSDQPLPAAPNGKILTTAAIARLSVDSSWDAIEDGSCRLVELVRPRTLPDVE